ncbi:sensor histidine kinase [Polaribacter sp. Asnod1-A03]|uniref:sensor histidine kinase n=1 Tax=Polaribacter sp. Asnod1-A03 TaxID=3160581 RepID=UPI00386C8131
MYFNLFYLFILLNISLSTQKTRNSINDRDLLSSFFEDIQQLKINKASEVIVKIENTSLNNKIRIYFEIKKCNGFKQHNADGILKNIVIKNREENLELLLDLLILSENEISYKNDRLKAFDYAYKGLELSKKLNTDFLEREFLILILNIFKNGIINNDDNVEKYLDQLFKLSKNNKVYLFKYYEYKIYLNEIGLLKTDFKSKIDKRTKISLDCFKKLESLIILFDKNNSINIEYYHLKALILSYNDIELSLTNLKYELKLLENKKDIFFNKYKYENLKELARKLAEKKQFLEAINYLNQSKTFESKITPLRNKFVYNLYISEMYYGLNKKDSAFIAMKLGFQNSISLNFKNQNNLISSLEIKNKTVEKEKQIFELDTKRKQNLSFLIVTLSSLILISIIATLSLKNSKRKRKLAEQEKELETIKNLTLLKEQEITTINAMVDGQEKERKRIAEDLHDNLGSVLATLKLHFENLKINREKKKIDQKELFNKTENLIDEAYLKVRRIAHAKNAGVIANQGLLLAIQVMAEKISSADKIQIEVIHFGLDKRLENTLEITLFRIIQELVTNIIKHADAKNATINISLYDKNLNIIIEDDGKGFNIKKVNLNNGMGISSIKTRIEHLNGTFEIDSTLGKGSSIIIDIPVS